EEEIFEEAPVVSKKKASSDEDLLSQFEDFDLDSFKG
ncbi:MAG: GTPase-activating protein, partial [Vibrio cyclitrophicus]